MVTHSSESQMKAIYRPAKELAIVDELSRSYMLNGETVNSEETDATVEFTVL